MLTIKGKKTTFCDGISRRSFLQIGSLALGGLNLPEILKADDLSHSRNRHKSIIMVFLPGGPSHMDIWDLKPLAPSEVRGEFRPIQTTVPGIQICEHLPALAQQMDRFAIIRSLEAWEAAEAWLLWCERAAPGNLEILLGLSRLPATTRAPVVEEILAAGPKGAVSQIEFYQWHEVSSGIVARAENE